MSQGLVPRRRFVLRWAMPTPANRESALRSSSPRPVTFPAAIRRAVEVGLSERFGVTVGVVEARNIGPSRVFRCTLWSSAGAAPGTVIVRIPREEGADPLGREKAALELLAAVGSTLAPRFLAGGAGAGFLASEDLGPQPSLLGLLLGKDQEAAAQGTLAFARGLGRLHAQTAQGSPAGRGPAGLPRAPSPVAEHWRSVREAVERLGLPAPQGVDRDVEEISRALTTPGDYLALSSGDPSVVNCQITDGFVRFFDFESACFRHALCDAAVLRFPYPTGGPPWRLPSEIVLRAEVAYRTELARACPDADADASYERGMAAACAAWMIVRLARLSRVDAGPDRDSWPLLPLGWSGPVPTRSRRRQLVSILETWVALSDRTRGFDALAAWGARLTDALRARWPEASEELPLYPAFEPRPDA